MSETKLPSDIQQTAPEWLSALPEVRGSYKYQFTMADICWFRVGGAADVVFYRITAYSRRVTDAELALLTV